MEPTSQRFSIFDLVRVEDLCRAILSTPADIHDYDAYVASRSSGDA